MVLSYVGGTHHQSKSLEQIKFKPTKSLERLDCKGIKRAATSYDQMRYVKKSR